MKYFSGFSCIISTNEIFNSVLVLIVYNKNNKGSLTSREFKSFVKKNYVKELRKIEAARGARQKLIQGQGQEIIHPYGV